jgi:hypothetical protein
MGTACLSTGVGIDEHQFGIDFSLEGTRLAIGARLDEAADGDVGAVYMPAIPVPPGFVRSALVAVLVGACARMLTRV